MVVDWSNPSNWLLCGIVAAAALYAISWLIGHAFGRGFFSRRKQYNDELLDKLRRSQDGTEG